MTDSNGTPLAVAVTAGQVHESTQAQSVISLAVARPIGQRRQKRRRRHRPKKVAADKGYSVQSLRDWLKDQRIKPVIPHKENEKARHDPKMKFDGQAYRGRCVVEHCVGWLKELRRIGTRYEKLAVHFLGMIHLAMIHRYLRMLF